MEYVIDNSIHAEHSRADTHSIAFSAGGSNFSSLQMAFIDVFLLRQSHDKWAQIH